MRLPKDQREIVNGALDECIDLAEGDVTLAAHRMMAELYGMEAFGKEWVTELIASCMSVGVKQMVRQRIRSKRVAVSDQSMPAYYTVGLSSAQWMHVEVDELDPVIERLTKSARSYTEHAAVLIDAQKYAKSHGVPTAAEAFAAEGVPVVELAS